MASWFFRDKETSEWVRNTLAPTLLGATIAQTPLGGVCLFVAPGWRVAVNGAPLATGLRILQHRDEIACGDGTVVYFTTEDPPAVAPFAGPPAKCGRCRIPLTEGAPSIRCNCGVHYHHAAPSCFEYGDNPICVACSKPTRLDGSGLWSPEEDTA